MPRRSSASNSAASHRNRVGRILCCGFLLLSATGCARFIAARICQSPNSYPTWLAPTAPVELAFAPNLLTNFPAQYLDVKSPPARLRYRVVEPADYQFAAAATNWVEHGRERSRFTFSAKLPGATNHWTAHPRGTVFLLHGYGVGMFAMAPWSLALAGQGWRCVLLDLRGHGKSSGAQIYFGLQETQDLEQLLDELSARGPVAQPVVALGESYGAVLGMRWRAADSRVQDVIALAPYASLSNSVLNICREYASWFPRSWLQAGLRALPQKLGTTAENLNADSIVRRQPAATLFVVGPADRITPLADVTKLFQLASGDSELLIVPQATHEAVTYYFDAIEPVAFEWLNRSAREFEAHAARAP